MGAVDCCVVCIAAGGVERTFVCETTGDLSAVFALIEFTAAHIV